MAEVAELSPYLLDYVRQRGQAAINNAEGPTRPESLDLGERTRRIDVRAPFVLTCDSFARAGRYIVLWCNPSSWQWSLKQRGTVQKTRGGSVKHMWRDRTRPTYFDEAEVNITFQSGNIIPIRTRRTLTPGSTETVEEVNNISQRANRPKGETFVNAGKVKASMNGAGELVTTIPPGLLNFYEFIEMMDEPIALDDGSPNYITIIASTPMFPQLVIKCFANPDGLQWAENDQEPNSFDWTQAFTIISTYPELNSGQKLRSMFESMSGKSAVNSVLVDHRGLRRDAEGNVDFNQSKNHASPPRATPGKGPSPATSGTPNSDMNFTESEAREITSVEEQRRREEVSNMLDRVEQVAVQETAQYEERETSRIAGAGPLEEALLDIGGPRSRR